MKIRSSIFHWAIAVTCLFVLPAGAQPRLFFVPQGLEPGLFPSGRTQITALVGDRVCLEIYFTAEPPIVGTAQAVVPAWGAGGDAGSFDIDCTTVVIDETHPRFPPGQMVSAVYTAECPNEYAILGVVKVGDVPITTGDGAYMGELCYDASNDASGIFAVDFLSSGGGYPTGIWDPFGFPLTDFIADGADITVVPAPACCLPDGTCEQLDLPECVAAGGFHPGPLNCADVSCLGACCVDSVCSEVSHAQCDAAGGIFYGEGTECAGIECACFLDAHCDDGDECTIDRCVNNECISCERHAADVNQDCTINVFDAFCVLRAMSGDFGCDQPCP